MMSGWNIEYCAHLGEYPSCIFACVVPLSSTVRQKERASWRDAMIAGNQIKHVRNWSAMRRKGAGRVVVTFNTPISHHLRKT